MAKTQGKVSFYLKDPKSKGLTSIRVTFCYNNMQMKYYEPKLSIIPKFWNSKEQKAREVKEFPFASFNTTLKIIANTILDQYQRFKNDNNNLEPTPGKLREMVSIARNKTGAPEERIKLDLFSFLDSYLEDIYKKINPITGKQISTITVRAYKQTFRLLKEYRNRTKSVLDFHHINTDFYNSFSYFLTHEKGFKLNTLGKHLRNIKTFMQEAFDRNLTTNINFKKKSFRVISEKTDSIYLNELELNELENLDLTDDKRLEKVRDLFLVGCWTGLRFSDFSKIKSYNIKGEYIEIEQQKTGSKVCVPIHPIVQKIISKYAGVYPNSLPPAISNQKMNMYLKEIAPKVELLQQTITIGHTIKGNKVYKTVPKFELLVTHTARRSFATNQYLKGIPVHDIMKATGHKSSSAFQRYLKIDDKDAAIRLNKFWKNEQLKAV
jgi:site-specific recombinase XerD